MISKAQKSAFKNQFFKKSTIIDTKILFPLFDTEIWQNDYNRKKFFSKLKEVKKCDNVIES